MLVITGQSGCGKTRVAGAIYEFCNAVAFDAYCQNKGWGKADHTPYVHFDSWSRINAAISNRNEEPLKDLFDADCLVIDDIGAETDSFKVGADRLCQVLSKREREFTVITTNIPSDQWAERMDSRISDRLLRNSVVVEMGECPSYSIWKLCQ